MLEENEEQTGKTRSTVPSLSVRQQLSHLSMIHCSKPNALTHIREGYWPRTFRERTLTSQSVAALGSR